MYFKYTVAVAWTFYVDIVYAIKYIFSARRRRRRQRLLELQANIVSRLTARLEPIWTYIDTNDFEPLSIECSDLGLSEDSSNEGVLMEPHPMEQLREMIKVKKALDTTLLTRGPLEPNWVPKVNEARDMAKTILDCVENLGWRFLWKPRERRDIDEAALYPPPNWRAEFILQVKDEQAPHMLPVLANNVEILPEKLTVAEFLCITGCTKVRLALHQYYCHRIIPVTVISLSMRSARIVHAYFDANIEKLRVFKSPILELQGEHAIENMHQLLAWCLGKAKT